VLKCVKDEIFNIGPDNLKPGFSFYDLVFIQNTSINTCILDKKSITNI